MKLSQINAVHPIYKKCCSNFLYESQTLLEFKIQPDKEKYDTIGDLDHDYPIFMSSLKKNTKNPGSLTFYSKKEYEDKGAELYKLSGIDAGFAIASDGDIISVHNSDTSVKGMGKILINLAKKQGGTKLDHFDLEPLNTIYSQAGFKEYDRYQWNDEYAPPGWDYEKYGRPDLVLRSL